MTFFNQKNKTFDSITKSLLERFKLIYNYLYNKTNFPSNNQNYEKKVVIIADMPTFNQEQLIQYSLDVKPSSMSLPMLCAPEPFQTPSLNQDQINSSFKISVYFFSHGQATYR